MAQHNKNLTHLLQTGIAHHRAGRLQEAEQTYRQVLAQDELNAEANHLLGVIACQAEQYDTGIAFIRKALQVKPDYGAAHKSLGKALKGLGQLNEAAASLRRAVTLVPDYAEALNDLGIVLQEQGNAIESIASFRRAVASRPDYGEAHYNLGNIYRDQGQLDEAAASYRRAISIRPDHAEAHNNLGNVLRNLGRPDEALASYRKALAINYDYAEAHNNLGNLLNDQGTLSEAIASFRRSIVIKPDFVEAYSNLGTALMQQGQLAEAVETFEKALAFDPEYSKVHHALGHSYFSRGQLDKAVASYGKMKNSHASAYSNLLFSLNYVDNVSQEYIYRESLTWGNKELNRVQEEAAAFVKTNTPEIDRRLRIGYVSPDFRGHSVLFFFEPVLQAHSRENFEIFCYANVSKPDSFSERLQGEADHWSDIVPLSDAEAAERIYQDRIDILVDLAGHTGENRLPVFALKPAPVQLTWLGYPNTTGLKTIDYRLTDAIADPVGEADRLHTEELVRLEHGFLCYRADASAPEVASPPCLARGCITFGSFNNLTKITSEVVQCWAEILRAVPGSRLMLKAKQMQDKPTAERLRLMFVREGISADRLDLFSRLPQQADHLALYNRVDIGLDPFPYNGTTTTCEALWMGVPVVTQSGNRHAGRVGASILHRVGLDELVTKSTGQYVNLAKALAADRNRLQELRGTLRGMMRGSALMDKRLFTATLEDAYRGMWKRWCDAGAGKM